MEAVGTWRGRRCPPPLTRPILSHPAAELIQTEIHHVRTLKIMANMFRKAMLEDLQMDPAAVQKIFPCVDELSQIHERFLTQLLERRRESLAQDSNKNFVINRLGDILVNQVGAGAGLPGAGGVGGGGGGWLTAARLPRPVLGRQRGAAEEGVLGVLQQAHQGRQGVQGPAGPRQALPAVHPGEPRPPPEGPPGRASGSGLCGRAFCQRRASVSPTAQLSRTPLTGVLSPPLGGGVCVCQLLLTAAPRFLPPLRPARG